MRIAIDIDSTLHHYWDTLSAIALRRFGVELPYEEQFTWGITRLRPEQLEVCIAESHTDERILAGSPYPGAVSTVRAWHERGHFIHVTSHRPAACAPATARWLTDVGLAYDDVCCSWDKVSRCVELDIDVLIDDSPDNLTAALEHGLTVATLVHPWNRDVCEEEDIPAAADWPELARLLAPVLGEVDAGATPARGPGLAPGRGQGPAPGQGPGPAPGRDLGLAPGQGPGGGAAVEADGTPTGERALGDEEGARLVAAK